MVRRILLIACVAAAVALGAGYSAVAVDESDAAAVVVASVRGPLDQRALDFLLEAVRDEPGQVVILQLDNPGVASGDPQPLYDAVIGSLRPIAVWVGPSGAVAYGGAGQLLRIADFTGAAPGATIGYLEPDVVGSEGAVEFGDDEVRAPGVLTSTTVTVAEGATVPLVDFVVPTIGQFIATLDGLAGDDGSILETVTEQTLEDGTVVVVPSVRVRFLKPGLFTRFLRLAIRPEAAFFFLVAGLAAASFEFYAAGAGVTAAVAALSLFLAGYGFATLPVNWWAAAAAVAGMGLYGADFQRNRAGLRAVAGSLLLVWGGLSLTRASPQFEPRWWAVVLVVAGIAMFYVFALTTVVRARFSTRTIGREYLVGRVGIAETSFDPEGVVQVDGGRWRARAHRAAGISPGDAIEVLEVNGIVLEVGPATSDADPHALANS